MPKPFGLKKILPLSAAVFAVFFLANTICRADDQQHDTRYVAEISDVEGMVTLRRGFRSVPIENGTKLRIKDTLKTGQNGSIGIVFNDHTIMSLGPDSKMKIQAYTFNPRQSEFSFVIKLLRGTAAYVSGLIAKISPESAKFITPTASIGIRGTKMVIQVD